MFARAFKKCWDTLQDSVAKNAGAIAMFLI